jgi:hypothetical protein
MNGEHQFGLGAGHLGELAEAIARRHDAWLVNYTEPNGYKRHWFATKNRGEPFNTQTAYRVLKTCREAGAFDEVKG